MLKGFIVRSLSLYVFNVFIIIWVEYRYGDLNNRNWKDKNNCNLNSK